jgi:hypothetical protein
MQHDLRSAHPRGLGIGVRVPDGVEMPVQRIVEPAEDALDIRHRRDLRDLLGPDDLRLQPHEAVLGALGLEHVQPFGRVGQRHAAHVVQAAGQPVISSSSR